MIIDKGGAWRGGAGRGGGGGGGAAAGSNVRGARRIAAKLQITSDNSS